MDADATNTSSMMNDDITARLSASVAVAATVPIGIVLLVTLLSQDSGPGLNKEFPLQFRILARIRTPMLMFLVVPLSFLRWFYRRFIRDTMLRSRCYPQATSTSSDDGDGDNDAVMAGHRERCRYVVDQVLAWNRAGRPHALRTARPNWAAMSTKLSSNKGRATRIDTSRLNHILRVDENNLTLTCEPGVEMGQVTHALLPRNLALKVQVEMESITVGGVALGFGLETNSHTVGFFQETVLAYELLVPSGDILYVTKESDPDLFASIPWSHGSLGFLLSLTVQLIRVEPYVKITYIPTYSAQELRDKLLELSTADDTPTFLEATAYSKDRAVIQCGEFVKCTGPEEKARRNGINHFWKPFYYKWVETFLEKGRSWEVVPTKHFYHRFTRSIFWELEDMIPFANHPLYRVLWGWMGAPEVGLLKLFQGPAVRRASVYAHVVQESIMPIQCLREGLEKFDDWFGVYPLLVFPIRVYDRKERSGLLRPRADNVLPGKDHAMHVDLGAYGVPREIKGGKTWNAKKNIRDMEEWTRRKGGWTATYTDIMCTRKEFRRTFDHSLYDRQRERLGCLDAFPEVYDKIKPEAGIVDLSAEEALETSDDGANGTSANGSATNGATNSASNGTAAANGTTTNGNTH